MAMFHRFSLTHLPIHAGRPRSGPRHATSLLHQQDCSFANSRHLPECFFLFLDWEGMPRRNVLHVPEPRPRVRKWNREAREERLKSAVFAAMTEGRANPLSPSDIARHAGVSKALIYKHFGSVDALVDDAIRSRLQLLDLDAPAEHEDKAEVLERILRVVSKLREEIQNQPELIDLIGWSLGNPHPQALSVTEAVRRFCEESAARAGAGAEAAVFFLGAFASVLCDQQDRVSEEIQGDKS